MPNKNYINELIELLKSSKDEFIRAVKRLAQYRDIDVKQDPSQAQINRITISVDRLKAKFEKRLKKSFNRWQGRAIGYFMQQIEESAPVLTLSRQLKDELRVLLVNHYYSVSESFAPGTKFERVKQVEEIPVSGPSPAEEETNDDSFLVPFLINNIENKVEESIRVQLPIHAGHIEETTEQIANIARSEAVDDPFESEAIMRSRMAARGTTVSVTETQWPAEGTQNIAIAVTTPTMATATQGQLRQLQEVSPNVRLQTTNIDKLFAVGTAGEIDLFRRQLSNPQKMWVTMGDGKVRLSHKLVNGVTVGLNQAFRLSGGMLMFPTDSSLGAAVEEIINCRCHAIYF